MAEILVAVDGSKHSDKIVEYSCELARRLSSTIILLYVSTYPDLISEYLGISGGSPAPKAAPFVARAEKVTSKLEEKIQAVGLPHEVLFESGDPAEKILANASGRKVDMIVIGLKGLHGVDRIRSLGSVARKVIESSPCPVLVVT